LTGPTNTWYLTWLNKNSRIICYGEVIAMFKPIIEFCISNLASGAQKALETLEKDPNLDIIEYGCLGYCGKCASTLYALVNGEVVTGSTPDELVERIYQHIDENPMF
jgi:uncharacterized protein YuzB (UPF0349 family)